MKYLSDIHVPFHLENRGVPRPIVPRHLRLRGFDGENVVFADRSKDFNGHGGIYAQADDRSIDRGRKRRSRLTCGGEKYGTGNQEADNGDDEKCNS